MPPAILRVRLVGLSAPIALGNLVEALLEIDSPMGKAFLDRQRQRLEQNLDPEFYDITAWSLPLAYNLRTWVASGDVAGGRPLAEDVTSGIQGDGDLGWLVTHQGTASYRLAAALQKRQIQFRVAQAAFKAGGESYLTSSMTVFNEILKKKPDLLPALFEPFPTDRRGEVPENMKPWFDIPIFHRHAGSLSCIYVRQYIESAQRNFPEARRLTPEQIAAMDLVDELCNDPEIHLAMDFRPGDIQLLHNHQILHSRGDFENWPEAQRHRHLLRLWLCPQQGRALPHVFADRYGSVAPGNRGGIVVSGTQLNVPLEAV